MKTTTAYCPNCNATVEFSERKCAYCGADVLFEVEQKDVLGGTSTESVYVIEKIGDEDNHVISTIEFYPTGDIHVGHEGKKYEVAREYSYAVMHDNYMSDAEWKEHVREKTKMPEDHYERDILLLVIVSTIAYVIFMMLIGMMP